MRQGDDISRRRYGADIYIVLRRKGRYSEHCSTQDTSFPKQPMDIVWIPEPEHYRKLILNRMKFTLCRLDERRRALNEKSVSRSRVRRP